MVSIVQSINQLVTIGEKIVALLERGCNRCDGKGEVRTFEDKDCGRHEYGWCPACNGRGY